MGGGAGYRLDLWNHVLLQSPEQGSQVPLEEGSSSPGKTEYFAMTDEHLALCLRENEVAVTPPPLQIKQGGGRPRSQVWQHFTACGDRNDKSRRFIVSCNACGQNLSSRVEAMEKHVAYDCKEVPEEGRLMIQQKIAGKTAVAGNLALTGAPAQKKPKTPKVIKQPQHLPHHQQQLQPPSTLICKACGVQYPPISDPPPCKICCDERQYVPRFARCCNLLLVWDQFSF